MVQILEIQSDLEGFTQIAAGGLQDGGDIIEHDFGLFFDRAGFQRAGYQVDRDLSRTENEIAEDDCLRIGADRLGRFVRKNCLFQDTSLKRKSLHRLDIIN